MQLNPFTLKQFKLSTFVITPVLTLVLMLALTLAFLPNAVNAKSIAITNATVYTVASQGILEQATVVMDEGKILAVYAAGDAPEQFDTDEILDAKGRILTPGFIASMNSLGLVEVGAVARTRDGSDEKADITFDASLAFNPKSTLIPYARKGGITNNIVAPESGEGLFAGQTFAVNLSGEFNSIIAKKKCSTYLFM